MGIAKHMMGKFYLSFLDLKEESQETENDDSNSSYHFTDESDSN